MAREVLVRRKGRNVVDLSGQRFGVITVVGPTAARQSKSMVWECRCDCGNTVMLASRRLRFRPHPKCFCDHRETRAGGEMSTTEIAVLLGMDVSEVFAIEKRALAKLRIAAIAQGYP